MEQATSLHERLKEIAGIRRKMIVETIQGLRNNSLSIEELRNAAIDPESDSEMMQVIREIVRDDMLIWRTFKIEPEWNRFFYQMLYEALEAHAGKRTFPIIAGTLDDLEKVTPPLPATQDWIDWWHQAYQWTTFDKSDPVSADAES